MFPTGQFVSYPGGTANFLCLSLTGVDVIRVQWLINGTLLTDSLSNVEVFTRGLFKLQFFDLPLRYNMTDIGCIADLSSGKTNVGSNNVTLLLLQGRFSGKLLAVLCSFNV